MRRSVFCLLLVPLCGDVLGGPGAGAPGFSAGAARVEITPDARLTNWVTHRAYGEVLEPIHARAIVVAQGERRVAIVSWELLYAMETIVARLRSRISEETGIAATDILVNATHNHSAPWSPVEGDPLTKAEQKVLDAFVRDPLYPAWTEQLLARSVGTVKEADAARRPATLSIGYAFAGDVVFNRRPVKPDGAVQSLTTPADPFVLPNGLRFGPAAPPMAVLSLRDEQGRNIAVLLNAACHAVCVYPHYDGIAADWPGTVSGLLEKQLGGEALVLQGCAGDLVPMRRGPAERDRIAEVIAGRALAAVKAGHALALSQPLRSMREVVRAPAADHVRADTGREHLPAEVQVISCGSLALVALPGEPLVGLANAIQKGSPFPHTLVLGYSNGYGVQYVGLPGDKARGGYEMGVRNLGTDAAGQMLVDAALRLLR